MLYDTQDVSWPSSVVAAIALGAVALTASAQEVSSAPPESTIPEVAQAVAPHDLYGVGLVRDHLDESGYAESQDGFLVVELDPQAGPITLVRGNSPYYLEAQFVTTQRDGIWLARKDAAVDVLPSGASYEIPYGFGALKRSMSAVTLVEAMLQPHVSDNRKTYELFRLRDLYVGGVFSLVGLRADVRYVDTERYVAHAQVGVNLGALAGVEINRTYAAFALPVVVGGGFRYPSILSIIGSHWTTGAELMLGFIGVDDDPDTANAVALPGLFHEVEWTFEQRPDVQDYRSDPRPYNYGVQSFYVKLGAYADFFGGAVEGLLFDIHLGYRGNFLLGPSIPEHAFKATEVTYATERYTKRKQEEELRRKELEALRRSRAVSPSPTEPR